MSALHDFLGAQVPNEKQIRRDLLSAARDIEKQIAKLKVPGRSSSSNIRIAQYRVALAYVKQQIAALWLTDISPTIAKGIEASASAAANLNVLTDILCESAGLNKTVWEAAMRQTAINNLTAYRQRVEGSSFKPLSERVYRNIQLSQGLVDRTITNALLAGKSAREMAVEVASLIRPDVKGGISYAALRLGRTELNNAFHATTIEHHGNLPWVNKMEWHLSRSHPKPDACDNLVGMYKPENVPGKPHPQCFCHVTPVTISEDQFVKRFKRGDFDSSIEGMLSSVR